jgi:proteasome lid subunit RPN8/RPN11
MFACEECWILLGRRRGENWLTRRVRRCRGERTRVEFNGRWALKREETHGDIAGFFHTHPPGCNFVSARDVRTMRAWCSAFGKPLLCVIASAGVVNAWRFDDDDSDGIKLYSVTLHPRGIVRGVDHGRKISSRRTVSRRRKACEAR